MVLYLRKWRQTDVALPQQEQMQAEAQVEFYDGGDTIGWLRGTTWTCWRVLERKEQEDGTTEEILEAMPEDWCPFFVASVESYSIVAEGTGFLELPGWRIETTPVRNSP